MNREKNHINQSDNEPIEYRRQTSNIFISWYFMVQDLLFLSVTIII